jgi:hypothetical protein
MPYADALYLAPHPWPGQNPSRRVVLRGAELLKRVFGVEALRCECGHSMRVIAAMTEPTVAKAILKCMGLPPRAPPLTPARTFGFASDPGPKRLKRLASTSHRSMTGSQADHRDERALNLRDPASAQPGPQGRGACSIRFTSPRGVPNAQGQAAGALKSSRIGPKRGWIRAACHSATWLRMLKPS